MVFVCCFAVCPTELTDFTRALGIDCKPVLSEHRASISVAMEARQRISRGDGFGETVSDKKGHNAMKRSFMHSIIDIDHRLTGRLAICANSNSTYGFLRPVMMLLELSAHGVPWIVGSVLAIFIAHQTNTQQKLLNLLMGE